MLGVTNLAGFGAGLSVVTAGVTVLHERVGNVNSTHGGSASWSLDVGTGSGRVALIAAKMLARSEPKSANISNVTVGGVNATQQGSTSSNGDALGERVEARLYVIDLSANGLSGSQTVSLNISEFADAFGLDLIVVQGLKTLIAEDSGTRSAQSGNSLTTPTIECPAGGITIGCAANQDRTAQTWGNVLTERADLATGGTSDDFRSGFAYALGQRAATAEQVSFGGSSRCVLNVASFR